MPGDPLQHRADALAARIEALAVALRASGVSDDTSERLLSRASAAALQALTLELLLEEPELPGLSAPRPRIERERGFRLAA